MKMKQHILAALSEEYQAWERLLNGLSAAQAAAPDLPGGWSIKDVVAHLRAWQTRTIERVEAARLNQAPVFAGWPAEIDSEDQDSTEQINAWIYDSYREQPWAQVVEDWRAGFQRLLAQSEAISERVLLDSNRYAWLNGHALAYILIASYDHHQEHYEQLADLLEDR